MQIFVNSNIILIVSCRTHHDVYFQNVSAKTQGGGGRVRRNILHSCTTVVGRGGEFDYMSEGK